MSIQRIDRATAQLLGTRVLALLGPLAAEMGLKLERGSGTFSDTTYGIKVSFNIIGGNGVVMNDKARGFEQLAGLYGMKAEWLGKSFEHRGYTFTITGLNSRAQRMPVLVRRSDGKQFKMEAELVKLRMQGALAGGEVSRG